jgi:Flp pilus assembly pilin Flp
VEEFVQFESATRTYVLKSLKQLLRASEAQDIIEYALIAAFVSVVAVSVLATLGVSVEDVYRNVAVTTTAAAHNGSPASGDPGSSDPGDGSPGNGDPGNGNPGNGNPGNGNPGNGNPGNGNPGNGNPGKGKP